LEVPKERKGSVALQHQDYLYRFLDILSKLERASPETSDPASNNTDEETELRLWADLREHQLKFQEKGGVYGFA
jgi:predicted component of type VI protein secretion system